MKTPCLNICQLEDDRCIGCGRTIDEIAQWVFMTDDEREQVMKSLQSNELYLRNQRGLS